MTRSTVRELAMHLIYAMEYTGQSAEETIQACLNEEYFKSLASECDVYAEVPDKKYTAYVKTLVSGVMEQREALDAIIEQYAIGWKLHRIARLPRVIMQIAIYEAKYMEDVPVNVAIHEAVKLTKRYEEEETVAFVNGILGAFARGEQSETVPEATT